MDSNSLVEWIIDRDKNLRSVAETWESEYDVESCLASILWDNTSTFVTRCIKHREIGEQQYAHEAIQYISYPLLSHYKASQKGRYRHPWIDGYPLFFGSNRQRDNEAVSPMTIDILARYAVLYRGLVDHKTGFSFTGFADSETFTSPRRCVVIDLDIAESSFAELGYLDNDPDTLRIKARFPRKPSLDDMLEEFKSNISLEQIPTFDTEYPARKWRDFWSTFRNVLEVEACRRCCDAIEELAPVLSNSIKKGITGTMKAAGLPEPTHNNPLDEKLAVFCAWNYLLGFRNIVFIPYRTVEARAAQQTGAIRSYSGIVLVMDNAFKVPDKILSTSEEKGAPTKLTSDLQDLVAAFKTLVDIATSRASISDARFYFANSILRNQARGLHEGMRHEARNLHFTTGLALAASSAAEIKRNSKSGEKKLSFGNFDRAESFLAGLDISRRISGMILEAFTEVAYEPFKNCWEAACEAIDGRSGIITKPECSKLFFELQVPVAFRFVFAELLRNAMEYRQEPSTIRTCIEGTSDENFTIKIMNATDNTVEDWCRLSEDELSRSRHGLDLVSIVACDIFGCEFSFCAKDQNAIAKITKYSKISTKTPAVTGANPTATSRDASFSFSICYPFILILWSGDSAKDLARSVMIQLDADGIRSVMLDENGTPPFANWLSEVKGIISDVTTILLFVEDTTFTTGFSQELLEINTILGGLLNKPDILPVHFKGLKKNDVINALRASGLSQLAREQNPLETTDASVCCEAIKKHIRSCPGSSRLDYFEVFTVFHFEDRRSIRDLFYFVLDTILPNLKHYLCLQKGNTLIVNKGDFGSALVSASTLNTALAFINESKYCPNIAVIDLHVEGGMKGMSVLKQIRKLWPKTQVMIVSGHDEEEMTPEIADLVKHNNAKFIPKTAKAGKKLIDEIFSSYQNFDNGSSAGV